MCIAFDFDGVLTEECILDLAKKLINEKVEIWIVTMRKDNDFNNKILMEVLKELGITNHRVIFCNNKPKVEMLEMINADIYIDNVNTEFENIVRHTNIIPLLYKNY